jgi:ABC-type thiamin/hydroxymethylpyrimidine transport system permease subunit
MDSAHLHLMLTHVPVIGSLLGSGILAWGLVRKQPEVVRIALGVFVVSSVVALPVYFSGEGAEDIVERLPGVAESIIEQHEDLAKLALGLILGLGGASVASLLWQWRQKALSPLIVTALLAFSLLNDGILAQTAHLGGQIRHSEIRGEVPSSTHHQAPFAQEDED